MLDLAIAHQCGVALLGPPASDLVVMPDVGDVRAAQSEAVAWYARHDMPAETVAAACRGWHWRVTGRFAAKQSAMRWALARFDDDPHEDG